MSTPPPADVPLTDGSPVDEAAPSFLSRRTWGLSHYLWIALAVTFAVVFIPRGVRKALEGNTNKAEDWLPPSYAESVDLAWFRGHFAGEAFVLISWDGCTLGNTEKLRLLQQKLGDEKDPAGWAWYPRLVTGPDTLEQLTTGPADLSRSQAIQRLEGALIGPQQVGEDGQPLGDGSRVTCLLAYLDDRLTDSNLQMRRAVERVRDLAHEECGVPLEAIHLGGPPVDNITIDIEGERTLIRLAGLSGLVGIVLAYLCFRSEKLTAMVFWTAGASAGMSLALVYWLGGVEMLVMGLDEPRLGKADAILMSMPAVVYVLALSGAIHLVNYYRDERLEHGLHGAAENAVRVAWGPCLLAAFTTAVGLGSLGASDILPIQKFGIFSAIGVLVTVALLFSIMPVFLHRFPPDESVIKARKKEGEGRNWFDPLARFTTRRYGIASVLCLTAMVCVAVGLTKIKTSVQLLNLLDDGCQLITDYTWLEEHLGNLVPMEVIVALDDDQLRTPEEPAIDLDGDDPRYRMTMYERAQLARWLQAEVEALEPVSRVLSAATFSGARDDGGSASARRAIEYTTSEALEASRGDLREYLLSERTDRGEGELTGRELWRVSARVTALGDIDYGSFVADLRHKVEPVLDAYQLRDQLVAKLAEQGTGLDRARVCLLTETNDAENPRQAPPGTPEAFFGKLLADSQTAGVRVYPLAPLADADEDRRAAVLEQLSTRFDAVVALRPAVAESFTQLGGADPLTLTLDEPAVGDEARAPATEASVVYTGVVPVVYKTQRELLVSLKDSILWATGLIACVMVFVLRSPAAGVASMIPNVFPIVMVFGALGWLGIKIDIGIMMTASVALGVAVDDTLHFVTWFGRGIRSGLDRRSATIQAYDRCATAMTQTTLIGGLGLAVFAVSTFTPTQEFGCLMICMLGMALIGDLILLPALLCGPLGRFFAPGAPATPEAARGWSITPRDDDPDGPSQADPAPEPTGPRLAMIEPAEPAAAQESAEEAIEPEPARTERLEEPLSSANAALRSKLQRLRRWRGAPTRGGGEA